MVNVTSDGHRDATCFFLLVSQHAEHLVTEVRMLKEGSAVLGGEDYVEPNLNQ